MTDDQIQIVDLVKLAKASENGNDIELAKRYYQQALSIADRFYGELSPATGLVIIEFMSMCEEQGQDQEATLLRNRLGRIIWNEVVCSCAQPSC